VVALSQPDNTAQGENKSNEFSDSLITILKPTSAAAEAYRRLRTSLLYALDDEQKVILVTSPGSAPGKSSVCANLGVVLAQAEKNTLIADCDFRGPEMHEMFGLSGSRGIVDALGEKGRLDGLYRQPLSELDLKVLTAGVRPSNPAELLSSPRVSEFFTNVRAEFDFVLVDAPPTGLVSDPLILAAQADGVLLTVDAMKTGKHELRRSIRDLNVAGANVLGTVVIGAGASKNAYF
jgi:capsular exopolysaccharide synthesis family protein